LAVGTRRSGAIVFRRVSMVARTSCFGSSTTDSRGLCWQHLRGRGRRHGAVESINVHGIHLSYWPGRGTYPSGIRWYIEVWRHWVPASTSSHLCPVSTTAPATRILMTTISVSWSSMTFEGRWLLSVRIGQCPPQPPLGCSVAGSPLVISVSVATAKSGSKDTRACLAAGGLGCI
jgi:hypothetical protein